MSRPSKPWERHWNRLVLALLAAGTVAFVVKFASEMDRVRAERVVPAGRGEVVRVGPGVSGHIQKICDWENDVAVYVTTAGVAAVKGGCVK